MKLISESCAAARKEDQVAVAEQIGEGLLAVLLLRVASAGLRVLAVEQPGEDAGRDGEPGDGEHRAAPAERGSQVGHDQAHDCAGQGNAGLLDAHCQAAGAGREPEDDRAGGRGQGDRGAEAGEQHRHHQEQQAGRLSGQQ